MVYALLAVSAVRRRGHLLHLWRGRRLPAPGLSLRWFEYIAHRPEFVSGTINSLSWRSSRRVLALVLGILASLAMVRYRFRWQGALEALFLAPLVVPSLIIGVSLLYFFSTIGFMDSFQRLVLAHLILTVPYTIRSISATLYGLDPSYEEVSRVMGAGPWRTFREVLLPMLRPGIVLPHCSPSSSRSATSMCRSS